ncbi:unnamed protein product [Ilex paraguariensis]|uniref:Uncharacterized protein n=1 Tax=Ilex paraguariensis TaxID=185542 RepID=A0ABC8SUA0_9AQUA
MDVVVGLINFVKAVISNPFSSLSKSAQQGSIDAYAAMIPCFITYHRMQTEAEIGECHGIELVLPKKLELQNKLRKGPTRDEVFFPEEFDV